MWFCFDYMDIKYTIFFEITKKYDFFSFATTISSIFYISYCVFPIITRSSGYVFGAKCFDGYLLFEVLEIDTLNWRATFKYRFNATNEF